MDELDDFFQTRLTRLTFGLSPAGLTQMYAAWLSQLALCPGRIISLATFPSVKMVSRLLLGCNETNPACAKDPRFSSPSWKLWPWNLYVEIFHGMEEFWDLATKNIPGQSAHAEQAVSFMARQILDARAPSNFLLTNPDLLFETFRTGGLNLVQGAQNAADDFKRNLNGEPSAGMESFKVGENLAATKGKVVFKNDLIELIQYEPTTTRVYKEPVLILPAWIMKYYILDLSPENSLVKWLTAQGHSVFIVSWKNPDKEDRDKGMDTYVREGSLAAIDAVSSITKGAPIHLTGYCLGGTLAMITAALMAHDNDKRLKSLSLFAAQGDFTEAGEMMVFVSPSEVDYLEKMMKRQGYLDTKQMAGAFQMLRSYDLIWSRMVKEYMMGQRGKPFDIMAWNADATRMPYKMHSEYLERLFLNNEFANGRYTVLGKAIAPENITVPVFAVGTEKDHVAPWKSVYKIHLMADGEVTFALTNGGHNAGIVSEPGHPYRHYRMAVKKPGDTYESPDEWLENARDYQGSWWSAWENWLKDKGSKEQITSPQKMGDDRYKPLYDAPGHYVHQK
ncbi:MAG: alpha/beta fold hydrolase [Alphaproteobacteria bacterium]|nr:alpha/beta fold hydrolase [Alphaproteobacteria bacterium]